MTLVITIRFLAKTQHPLRNAAGGALSGVVALAAVNALSSYSAVTLSFNAVSLALAAVLGIPGVVMMLVMKLVFIKT